MSIECFNYNIAVYEFYQSWLLIIMFYNVPFEI